MNKLTLTILMLFLLYQKIPAQQKAAQESASAYAFLIDSVIIKRYDGYPQLKEARMAIKVISGTKDLRNYGTINNSSFWQELGNLYSNHDQNFLDKLVDRSIAFDLKMVQALSVHADKLLLLDSATVNSHEKMMMMNGMIYDISNAVFSEDRQTCVLFYHQFQAGGYTVVLKRKDGNWHIVSDRMDWIE